MKRLSLIVVTLLAFVLAPQVAFAGDVNDCHTCARGKFWWVEIGTGGNCYVRYRALAKRDYAGRYISPMAAYKAIARMPACYVTADWLMQYDYIRRSVN